MTEFFGELLIATYIATMGFFLVAVVLTIVFAGVYTNVVSQRDRAHS